VKEKNIKFRNKYWKRTLDKRKLDVMNFLAHLFLSHHDDNLMIGNLIADFITNRDLINLSEAVREGVMMHRRIDTYTDSHPAMKDSVRRLRFVFHKYAPVVSDIYYDYLLIKNWTTYTDYDFETFRYHTYDILTQRMDEMPADLQTRLPKMIAHDWLKNYGTEAGLQFTFDNFAKRTTFKVDFTNAAAILLEYLPEFDDDFNRFFPDMMQYVNQGTEVSNFAH
jgi:acyl carrier protein phosphodiesterase